MNIKEFMEQVNVREEAIYHANKIRSQMGRDFDIDEIIKIADFLCKDRRAED